MWKLQSFHILNLDYFWYPVSKSIHQFCLLLLVTDVLFLMDNLVAFLHSFIYQSKYCFKTCENPSLLHIFGILTLDNLDLYILFLVLLLLTDVLFLMEGLV